MGNLEHALSKERRRILSIRLVLERLIDLKWNTTASTLKLHLNSTILSLRLNLLFNLIFDLLTLELLLPKNLLLVCLNQTL